MRQHLFAASLLLAACGAAPEPAPGAHAPALAGAYAAMSAAAASVTGDLVVADAALGFERGLRFEAAPIPHALEINTDLSAGGGTIAIHSGLREAHAIELRRVAPEGASAEGTAPSLCGHGPVSHLSRARNADALAVLAFSGAEAPGGNAHDSQFCAAFTYTPAN